MTTREDAICNKDCDKGVAAPPYPARAGFLPAISDPHAHTVLVPDAILRYCSR